MTPSPLGGRVRLGRYLLGDRLATGGMGEVYVAVQEGPAAFRKPLALKLLLPHLAQEPKAVEMFHHEARLSAGLSHPNIVQVLDVGEAQGRHYIAMELVQGVSLAHLIRTAREAGKPLPADVLLWVARSLAEGLHHAHEHTDEHGARLGLVHRDVTPHNVLVSVHGEVKLTDFGIAKLTTLDAGTRHGFIRGKVGYVAPEVYLQQPVDHRADLFSLGVTLFQLATLENPYARDSEPEVREAILASPLPSLAAQRPELPTALDAALHRLTERHPDARIATARAFRDLLPAPGSDAAATLAEVVRAQAKAQLEEIEQHTRSLVARQTAETEDRTEPEPRRRARRPLAAGVISLGAAALAFALWPAPAEPPPAPAPAPEVIATPAPPGDAEPAPAPPPAAPARTSKPVRRTEKPRATGRGWLNIDALPWAEVTVNGRRIGETPLARFPVDEGQVVIELSNPESGRKAKRTVKIVAGQTQTVRETLR